MRDHTQPGALPLRPQTTGELLDAAVVLLRLRAPFLLSLGVVYAVLEQVILFPLRRWTDVDSSFLPATGRLGDFGFVVVCGFFTETFAIAILGGTAARSAPKALLGWAAPPTPRPARRIRLVVVSTVVGACCALAAWSFLVLPQPLQVLGLVLAVMLTGPAWVFVYGLLGLAPAALVTDETGVGRALRRSLRLASGNGMRAAWVRVLGYLAWLFIRIGLALGTLAIIELFYTSPSNTVDNLIMGAAWAFVNALAYPTLGCLDVVLHLEARMRREGLDLALRRTVRRGVTADSALAVPK